MEEVIVDLERVQLATLQRQKGYKDTILALHGWLDNAASFIPLFESSAVESNVILVDLPGHGKSDHRGPGSLYHLVDYVLDVARFVSKLEASEQRVHLLGHSMGGVIASMVAAAMPESIHTLTMLDSLGPLVDAEDQVLSQLRKSVKKSANRKASSLNEYASFEAAVQARMGGFNPVSQSSAEKLVKRGIKRIDESFIWSTDPKLIDPSIIRLSESQAKAILSGVECPCLLIGGEQGYIKQYEMVSKRTSYIQRLELEFVEGGHHFHMDGDVVKTAELFDHFLTTYHEKYAQNAS